MGLPHEEMQDGGTSGQGTGEDAGVLVTMFKYPQYMAFKSKEAGREIYEDVDYISLTAAGQKHSVSVRKMKEADKEKFPHIWEAYQKNESKVISGTPISDMPGITRSKSLELKSAGFKSIESLASVPDTNLKAIGPGGLNLKGMAKKYLEGKDENGVKLDEANDRIAELEKKLDALMSQKAEATDVANPAPKKKPGRPRKHVPADNSTKCTE